jgi:hypothetical protein
MNFVLIFDMFYGFVCQLFIDPVLSILGVKHWTTINIMSRVFHPAEDDLNNYKMPINKTLSSVKT